jgi:hypothetical protein
MAVFRLKRRMIAHAASLVTMATAFPAVMSRLGHARRRGAIFVAVGNAAAPSASVRNFRRGISFITLSIQFVSGLTISGNLHSNNM